MAEDEGFEPSRLSSTRVRDARTRPLCESSVGDVNRIKVELDKLAEDEGFEPSIGFPIHAFQACALGRYANPPEVFLVAGAMLSAHKL